MITVLLNFAQSKQGARMCSITKRCGRGYRTWVPFLKSISASGCNHKWEKYMTSGEKKLCGMWEADSARRQIRFADWAELVTGPQAASHIGGPLPKPVSSHFSGTLCGWEIENNAKQEWLFSTWDPASSYAKVLCGTLW